MTDKQYVSFNIGIGTHIETVMREKYIPNEQQSLPLSIEGWDTGVNIVVKCVDDGTGHELEYRKVFLEIVKR